MLQTDAQHERVVNVQSDSKLAIPKDDGRKQTVERRAVKLHQLDNTKSDILTLKDTAKGQRTVRQEGNQNAQNGKAEKQVNNKLHIKTTATDQNVGKIVGRERKVEKVQDEKELMKLNAVKKDVAEEQSGKNTVGVRIMPGRDKRNATKLVNKAKEEQVRQEQMVTGREAEKERQTAAILGQTNKIIAKEQTAKKIVGQKPTVTIRQAPRDQTNVILKSSGKETVNNKMVGQSDPVNKANVEQSLKGQEAAKGREKENVSGQAKPVVSKEQMMKKTGQEHVVKVHRDQTKPEAVGQNKQNATKPARSNPNAVKERGQTGKGFEPEQNGTKPKNQEETAKFQRAKTEQKASILGNVEKTVGKGKEVTIQSKGQQTGKERLAEETAKQAEIIKKRVFQTTVGQERRVNVQAGKEPAKTAILKQVKVT
ncbi:uncharacterized protein [Eucyclogobius newberryi]|uniref:uncharacterized protein n=1 Tax=Eucyclogobius newberryi TaxID=166745 RepID=UPI003B5C2B3F